MHVQTYKQWQQVILFNSGRKNAQESFLKVDNYIFFHIENIN